MCVPLYVYTIQVHFQKTERKKESERGKRGNFNITIETFSYRPFYTYTIYTYLYLCCIFFIVKILTFWWGCF